MVVVINLKNYLTLLNQMTISELVPKRKASTAFLSIFKTATSLPSSHKQIIPHPSTPNSFSELMMEENIEKANTIITKYDLNGPCTKNFSSIFLKNRNDAKIFISCVKGLREAMHYLVTTHSYCSTKLVLAQKLMQVAMRRLELEFHLILISNKEHLKPESISSHSSSQSSTISSSSDETKSLTVVLDLKEIADCMISAGYSKECARKFMIIRKSSVSEMLYNLGIERYSSTKINRMNSNDLKDHIKKWILAAKYSVRSFLAEKFLCDFLFSTSPITREICFAGILKQEAMNMFKFPELATKRKNSPDIVFSLLELYESIQEMIPDIESMFSYESISAVKFQAFSSLEALSNAIQLVLSSFETSLQKDSSRILVPGGGIHPLTISVLDFASSLANYNHVLSEIILFLAPEKVTFLKRYLDETSNSPVSLWVAWIILMLLCKLDSTAEPYHDIALSYLFLANNLQYIMEKVSTSALKYLLDEDYTAKLNRKVILYAANYEDIAWSKTLTCLPGDSTAEMSLDQVMDHFRKFHVAFEEALWKQMGWVVPARKLREEIKLSMRRRLVPAYQDFYNSQLGKLGPEKNLQRLLWFSPAELGNYLSDLFDGMSVSESSSTSPSSSSSSSSRN